MAGSNELLETTGNCPFCHAFFYDTLVQLVQAEWKRCYRVHCPECGETLDEAIFRPKRINIPEKKDITE